MLKFYFSIFICFFLFSLPAYAQTAADELTPFNPTESCSDPLSKQNALCEAFTDGTCSFSIGVKACVEKIQKNWADETAAKDEKHKAALEKKNGLFPGFGGIWSELVVLISSAITAGVIAWLQKIRGSIGSLKDNLLEYKKRLSDPVLPTPIEFSEVEGVNVVLIGEGGVGKTSLIRAISGSPFADPQKASDKCETYSLAQEVDLIGRNGEPIRKLTRIYLEDHKGQNIADMLLNDLVEKRQTMVPSTVLIIVVDLFKPDPENRKHSSYDTDRVNQQLLKYHSDMLKLIREKFCKRNLENDKTVMSVCLYINKLDLLESINSETIKSAKLAYKLLADDMRQKFADAAFFVVVGSASNGWGVVGHTEHTTGTDKTLQEIIMQSTAKIKIDHSNE